jgi:hypothetical protein
MLYGHGPAIYIDTLKDNKIQRQWIENKKITGWLESWQDNGIEMSYTDFAQANIKNHYYFRDYFVKWRMSLGKTIGRVPIAGLESQENKDCRLATQKRDIITDKVYYKDFRQILVGNWQSGAAQYQVYPKFDIRDIPNYRFAAISHHREKSVGKFYGLNETHQGTKAFIQGSNENAQYINSFLKNSLAAKIHIIIPNAWIESKRTQIKAICNENKKLKADNKPFLKYNGIEIGTEFRESYIILYTQHELRTLSKYLSGVNNQGKAYASISYKNDANKEIERWHIETVDLKYKEYIEAIIQYDKRADEVMLGSVGMDASISSVSKEGVISKSGADVYYNYLIYLMSLTPDDEKCSEPFNLALRINFPELYAQGMRIGYYREVPARQAEVSPSNRLSNQQS